MYYVCTCTLYMMYMYMMYVLCHYFTCCYHYSFAMLKYSLWCTCMKCT